MRYLFYTLMMFVTLTIQGQTEEKFAVADIEKHLTDQELSHAKELYVKMMESEIYKSSREKTSVFVQKLNGVPTPKKEDDLNKYFEEHLHETKFKSVREALSYVSEGIGLQVKLLEDNRELYLLLSKASKPQVAEILRPEFDAMAKRFQQY